MTATAATDTASGTLDFFLVLKFLKKKYYPEVIYMHLQASSSKF